MDGLEELKVSRKAKLLPDRANSCPVKYFILGGKNPILMVVEKKQSLHDFERTSEFLES